jgi:hypothetical protein
LPFTILPNEDHELKIKFQPNNIGEFNTELIISHDLDSENFVVRLNGKAKDLSSVFVSNAKRMRSYPNPARSGSAIILEQKFQNAELYIYDLNANLIQQENDFSGNKLELNVILNGVYFLKINNGNNIFVSKITIR